MKRTKSMIYKETVESRELLLYATNDGNLYRKMILPVIENLRKKAIKGIYDKKRRLTLITESLVKRQKCMIKTLDILSVYRIALLVRLIWKNIIEMIKFFMKWKQKLKISNLNL